MAIRSPSDGEITHVAITSHDSFSGRVHSPIPGARSTERIRADPSFWVHGQCTAFGVIGSLPPTLANGASDLFNRFNGRSFRLVLSQLSRAHGCCGEIYCGRTIHAEVGSKMSSRYVVASDQNPRPLVVPRHIDEYVCPPLNPPTSFNRGFGPSTVQYRSEPVQSLRRDQLRGRRDPRSLTTSTRIPLLSP